MTGATLSSLVAGTAAAFTALLFARALLHKLTDFTAFGGYLADYRLLPDGLVPVAAAAIALAEASIVLGLLFPEGRSFGAILAATLLLAYAAAMTAVIRSGRRHVECGCGGAVQPVGRSLVVRNLLLAAFALAGTLGSAPLAAGETIAVLAAGFTAFVGYILTEQILGNAAHAAAGR